MATVSTPAPSARTHTASVGAGISTHAAAVKTYTVRAGDTLYNIAQRFHTAVATLQQLNHLGAHSVLKPGLTLKLP